MVRVLFWILLIGNLALFATLYLGNSLFATTPVNKPLPELNPQKISLQRGTDSTELLASATASAVSAVSSVEAASAPAVTPRLACMEWAEFSPDELQRLQDALLPLKLPKPAETRVIEHAAEYWVYLPAPKSVAKLERRLAELKAAKVDSYQFMEEEGPYKGYFSLGRYPTQQEAKAAAAALKKVAGVRVGQLRAAYRATALRLSDLDGVAVAGLTGLQKQFPRSNLAVVACQ